MGTKVGLIVRPPGDEERVGTLRALVKRLRSDGVRVSARVTFEEGDARRFAATFARHSYDLVIAAGGDGTINEVVNGLARAKHQPRLGILPFGTANDFAAGLDLPEDVADALRIAIDGTPRQVDVGEVNRRCFINVSTGGFGAEATEDAPAGAKRLLGGFAYVLTGAKKLVELEPYQARFAVDGKTVHDGDFVFFAVGNAETTGGGTRVTPRAEVRDGSLDLVIVGDVSRLDFLSLLPDLRKGTHLESPDVLYFRASTIDVDASRSLPVNVDGEPMRARSFRYRLLDRPLTIMTP
jgi:YegS/Rv2252/BmrU family lipid kinase